MTSRLAHRHQRKKQAQAAVPSGKPTAGPRLVWRGLVIAALLLGHQFLLTLIHYFGGPALGIDPSAAGLNAATIIGAAAIIALPVGIDLQRQHRREAVGLIPVAWDTRTIRIVAAALLISQLPLAILALQGATIWQAGGQAQLGIGRSMLSSSGPIAAFALGIAVVLIASVIEEILYRGYLLGALARHTPRVVAVFIASLCFMLIHAEPANLVASLCLGVATGICRVSTRSVWPGLAVHIANNAFGLWYLTQL